MTTEYGEAWWRRSAVEVVAALREGRVTPDQLVHEAEQRIRLTDGAINATPILCTDRARAIAHARTHTRAHTSARTRMRGDIGARAHSQPLPPLPPTAVDYMRTHSAAADALSIDGAHRSNTGRCRHSGGGKGYISTRDDVGAHGGSGGGGGGGDGGDGGGNGGGRGCLHGVPVLIKDLNAVEGVRFTEGSPLYAHRVATTSSALVTHLEGTAEAVVMGKTNTPEFGAGANTFNEVFGTTCNPWDLRVSAGGSSGGAAAALAAGQAWLATGSDLGGSLRIPASFCGVVGMRPTVGRVVGSKDRQRKRPLTGKLSVEDVRLASVSGPMARNVVDLALFLDAMIDTLATPQELATGSFLQGATDGATLGGNIDLRPMRMAWSSDLGGVYPVDSEVADICRKAARWFAGRGAKVAMDTCPDLSDGPAIFNVLRAHAFATTKAHVVTDESLRRHVKPELLRNIEDGLRGTPQERRRRFEEATAAHRRLYGRCLSFFESHDLLLAPAAMVPPFDHRIRYVTKLNDRALPLYTDWLGLTSTITLTCGPALSLPCGFTRDGLPVGLQIIGPPFSELTILRVAAAFEAAHGYHKMLPVDPRTGNAPLQRYDGPRTTQQAATLCGIALPTRPLRSRL